MVGKFGVYQWPEKSELVQVGHHHVYERVLKTKPDPCHVVLDEVGVKTQHEDLLAAGFVEITGEKADKIVAELVKKSEGK